MAITKVTSGLISADASSIDLNIDAGTLYLDVSENRVGIGTTSPSYTLDVNGTIGIGTTSAGQSLIQMLANSTNGANTIHFGDAASGTASYTGYINYAHDSNSLQFATNGGTERMRIDSSGNVGIGTSSPDADLHISSAGGTELHLQEETSGQAAQIKFTNVNNSFEIGADANPQIFFINTTGNQGSGLCVDTSNNVGIGQTSPYSNASYTSLSLGGTSGKRGIIEVKNENDSANGYLYAQADALTLESTSTNILRFVTNGAERGRITSSGNLLVGTTTSSGLLSLYNSGQTGLNINTPTGTNTFAAFQRNGSTVGSITTNGSTTSFNTSSDARLKDITGKARGLEVINELNSVAYNWKESGQADEGLIAQEVLNIVPNAVSGSEEEYYQMDYSKLVVHLVAGMKEQQTIIDNLTTRIETLENA
jgi:hypothetical protein